MPALEPHTGMLEKTHRDLQDRALGAYLGLALGDALGATTEFMTPREIQQRYGIHRDIRGGGWLKLAPGKVTDDTEMTLALGRSVLRMDGVVAADIAEAFSDWMRSKPVDIGNTVRRGIVHYRHSGEPVLAPDEYNAGNGACMRCLPLALLHCYGEDADLVQSSRAQAHITHNNALADAATEAVLRMVVSALHGETLAVIREQADRLVARYPQFNFTGRRVENPSGWIVETLQVVFQSLFEKKTFEDTLVEVVNRGGDADTTGAIAGMLVGAFYGIDAIPSRWLKALDRNVDAACRKQTLALLELACRRSECDR